MVKFNHDFSSRFRILKGGKISLVVSAMLLGSTVLYAATSFDAEVTTSSPTFTVADDGNATNNIFGGEPLGGDENCAIMAGTHRYQTQTFIPTENASHTVSTTTLNGFANTLYLNSSSGTDTREFPDNFMAIYEGVFDPKNPTVGLVGCNDDRDWDNDDLRAEFSATLDPTKVYTMLFTSFNSVESAITAVEDSFLLDAQKATVGSGAFSVSPDVSLAYSLSGIVTGLANGETLTLKNNAGNDENITANGSFVFDTPLADSANYNITATLSNPSKEFRICTVSNGIGSINSANVDNISVSCNSAPTVTSTALTTIDKNNAYSYTLSGNDVDGDALTWSATSDTNLPSWLTLTTNNSWESVGSAGFSAGYAFDLSIALDNANTPYVVYRDDYNDAKATVMKFNGSAWEAVGNAGFSAGVAYNPSIVFDNNTPYVLYIDVANDYKATVMKFNGSTWEAVGGTGFSAGVAGYPSMAFDSTNTPYVVYKDGANGDKATVMKLNGSTWEAVGSAGFSAGVASYTSIAYDSTNTPYVVYKDGANDNKATVMKLNGSTWEVVGISGFSTDAVDETSIAFDGNTPYVAYQDGITDRKATVMKFNGATWEVVGSSKFSVHSAYDISIRINSTGTPYVSYTDRGNNFEATVMKFDGTAWEAVGEAGFSPDWMYDISMSFDSTGTPYVVYTDGANEEKATVMKFNSTTSLTGTPTQAGVYDVNLTLSDGENSVGHDFQITVVDNIPTITSTPITTVNENSAYSYTLTGNDVDGDALTWSVKNGTTLPSWLSLDSSSGAIVTTFAGDGNKTFADGNSTTASFNWPFGVAVDSGGNIFVADRNNNKIRKIDSSGNVTTVAGTGNMTFADGNSTTASFSLPEGVALDNSGNIIVADYYNHRIRKIDSSGNVTSFGNGTGAFADGNSTTASFYYPKAVAVDNNGTIFVADYYNHRIRKIDSSGNVTTVAGSNSGFVDGDSTTARFSGPSGIALDSNGNIIVADSGNNRIRKIDGDSNVTTVAGDGTWAFFRSPNGIAVDSSDNIFVADRENNRIRKIDANGNVTTVAGDGNKTFADGNSTTASFNWPYGVAVDSSGNVFVADSYNNKIRKITPQMKLIGTPTTAGVYDVNLTVSDGTNTVEHNFQITVANVNDIPTDINITNLAIRENNELNATIGILGTVDIDTTDTHTYTLNCGTDNDNNKFLIDGNSLKARERFDFETKSSYSICVRTTDSGNATYDKNMTVTIEDVVEDFEISIIEEGATADTKFATANEPFTYTPTKDGYTFAGWYTDATFETTFDPRAPITANTTLYPKWVANSNNSVTMSVNTVAYGVREVTLSTTQGLSVSNASNIPNPTGLGKGMKLPFGTFAFDISGGTNGFTAPMSIVVDKDVGSYTYYKQNNAGKWVNLTKKITFLANDKVQIDFDLTDGGVFDRDETANGTIQDPGGVATNALNPYVIEGTTLVGDASFVEDPSLFVGTLGYAITGGANSGLFEIDSATGELSFINAPVYNTTASNNYFVEVTASGSTSGNEIRAIMVTVLNADGDNVISPVGVAESCGTSARKNLLVAPIAGLCQSGIASAVTESNGMFTWSCNTGEESATPIDCSAKKVVPVAIAVDNSLTSTNTTVGDANTTTVTSGTNTIEATKFTTGDAKAQHIAKNSTGTELAKAISYVEGTQISVKPTGDVETTVEILGANDTPVSIKVDGKVSGENKAIHTLNVGGKETKASSKITGTITQIKADGEVETKATISGNEAKATALPDGTATHIITVGLVESKATVEIAGAQTVIDTTGITTSVDENQTIGGNAITVKSVVKTDMQGESQTWFEDSNGQQLERTVSANTPLESGAEVNVSKDATSGKLQFKIKTKVTRDLVIE
jgi:uncharacterized repeat protein (TIGR02543 family)